LREGVWLSNPETVMSENVVALRGMFQPEAPAAVDDRLIEELERVLAAVRSGEIIGMAGAFLHKDKAATYAFAGLVGTYSMVGGLECAKERLVRIATRDD
jgi:hypothetical protein